MSGVSRRRFVQGAAGGAAVAAGAFGASRLLDGDDADASELVPWAGPRQAGIVTPRTPYGMVAAYDVVTDDLPGLFRDLTSGSPSSPRAGPTASTRYRTRRCRRRTRASSASTTATTVASR